MANDNLASEPDSVSDFDTVEELGSHVQKLAALLRAAISCGPDGRHDEPWLVSIAHDEAEAAEACYGKWADAPRTAAGAPMRC